MKDFVGALLGAGTPVIAEIKCRTGAGADLLLGRDPARIAQAYADAGAACLSVVTGRWFGGTAGLLRDVVGVSRLPVLRKDFITSERQLTESVALGASAVLLTAQLLPATTLRRLVERALAAGLTPFVEVTGEAEVAAVPHAAECVIAVTNKDIRTRETGAADLGRSLRLLPAVMATGTRLPVSASGIDEPATAARLLAAGYAGLLVGTGLLMAASPGVWFDRLRQEVMV